MKSIRVISVGLIISAYLLYSFSIDFYNWELHDSTSFMYLAAINNISPIGTDIGGMKVILAAAYILMCMGLGFFISALVYSKLDTLFCNTYQAYVSRNKQTGSHTILDDGSQQPQI
jgi:hypothetical protein